MLRRLGGEAERVRPLRGVSAKETLALVLEFRMGCMREGEGVAVGRPVMFVSYWIWMLGVSLSEFAGQLR